MKKNFEEFSNFINELNYEFSVISLTETWCLDDPKNKSIFKLNSYLPVYIKRVIMGVVEGVLVYLFIIHLHLKTDLTYASTTMI